MIPCPCCGNLTLETARSWEICPVCWWEDDPVQFDDPDWQGGANGPSLNEAKEFYRTMGVGDPKMKGHERPPTPEEMPK
jgi:hypothetical protein